MGKRRAWASALGREAGTIGCGARLKRATGERTEAKHGATIAGVDRGEGPPEDKDQRSYEQEWKAARYTEIDLAAIVDGERDGERPPEREQKKRGE